MMVQNHRFNKTIVECKDLYPIPKYRGRLGFNKTIVECKGDEDMERIGNILCFNKTIVECKVLVCPPFDPVRNLVLIRP